MATYSAYDAVRQHEKNQRLGLELIDRLEGLNEQITAQLVAIGEQLDAAHLELGRAYVPTLDAEALARAEALSGFRGFSRRDPIKAMEHEAHVLRATIARIVADERWQRREYLVGEHGELTRELAEAVSMLEPWQEECRRFERLTGFLELVEIGYDTPEFAEQWYQPSYWKHWAQGDRVCTATGLADFGDDVLPAYHKVREPRDRWKGEVERFQALVDEVHDLVKRRDDCEHRIPMLPSVYLEQCQQQVAEFLGHADLGLLEEWLDGGPDDRAIRLALRSAAGLRAKLAFLEEAQRDGVTGQINELRARRAKHARKASKYLRPKNAQARLSAADLDLGFEQKMPKYHQRVQDLEQQVARIVEFQDYGRFDLQNDPELWFVVMTRKRPSRLTPRLRTWYERRPDVAPTLEVHDDHGAAVAIATAAADWDRDDRGYAS